MKVTSSACEKHSHARYFLPLEDAFGAGLNHDGQVIIPPQTGEGQLQIIQVEKGLGISAWNIVTHRYLEMQQSASPPERDRTFRLMYILTPEHFSVKGSMLDKEVPLRGAMQLLFDSGDHPLTYHFTAGRTAKAIVLHLSASWLLKAFGEENTSFYKFLELLVNPGNHCLFYEPVPIALQDLLREFHDHFMRECRQMLYNKAKALTLLSDFLYGLSLRAPAEAVPASRFYKTKVRAVEDILRQHIDTQLPCIRSIAEQVSLSESTLKRYFQLIYRRSIYDYYLQLKMEHAKMLLVEKRIAVKEVAYRLGYGKCSSFILMFKKFYRESPGFFRQRLLEAAPGRH